MWLIVLAALAITVPVQAGVPDQHADAIKAAADREAQTNDLMSPAHSGLSREERHAALLDRASTSDTVPVIVRFRESTMTEGLTLPERQSLSRAKRTRALAALGLHDERDRTGARVKSFERLDGFAMRASARDIARLINDPEVLEVVEDAAYSPAVLDSMPLIGAAADGSMAGYTGAGQTIAILDTGVDKDHPMLVGKVVSEACYSTSSPRYGVYSLCPDAVTSSTAVDSARPCDSDLWGSGCDHGTHVAGIAAGDDGLHVGAAKDAQVIAIQVYSGFSASACGGAPCVMAYTSDIIKGLERVQALRESYTIAAANLSLGGGSYTEPCDGDPSKPAIDSLRAAGIATVVASGNSGYVNALAAPACVSSAISVGATCDDAGVYCAAQDAVADYSNSADFLSLLAPGSLITSSVPGGDYASWHGTSMAAPHVAGAWAVLKEAYPTAGVDELLAAFRDSGKAVTDSDNGLTISRIQAAEAIAALSAGELPGDDGDEPTTPPALPEAPVLSAPTNVSTSGFTANWNAVPDAAGYRLDVSLRSDFRRLVRGYDDLDVGAATSQAVSGLRPYRTYYVRVRAYNAAGISVSSTPQSVTTSSFTSFGVAALVGAARSVPRPAARQHTTP